MQTPIRYALPAAAGVVCLLASTVGAQEWPNWRGPNHDGISAEKNLKTTLPEPLKPVWEREIGSAFSSFTCVEGKVYTCGTQDKQQVLFCLDADTGDVIWQTPFEKEYRERQGGDGTRATPTVDEGRVYILGALGTLLCCDAETGKEIWKKHFKHKPRWGYAGSVLIEGDLALVSAGKSDGALLALNKKTGATVWKCGDDQAGYATPYPFTFEGKRYIVGFMGKSIIIAEAKTGGEVWRMPWKTDWDVNASSPIYHDGHLFLSSGYKHGCILLRLRLEGDSLIVESAHPVSDVLRSKFQSCVLHEGHLYGCDEEELNCVEFLTLEQKWSVGRGRMKHGSAVLANGYLYVLTERGELQIAKATPDGYEPLSKGRILSGRCWTVPTLYRGRLYARNLKKAVCIDLRD